jgi:hypothetical protein
MLFKFEKKSTSLDYLHYFNLFKNDCSILPES